MLSIQKFTFNPFQENTYILYTRDKAVLIDPGMSNAMEENRILTFLKEHQLKIEAIWLTHAHIDHVMGLNFANKTFKTPIYMHTYENENLKSAERVAMGYSIPFTPFGEIKTSQLDHLTELTIGSEKVKLIFTPGHSAGSISFYSESSKIIVSGDVLFFQSIGRTDLPGGNIDVLQESILSKMYSLPKETIVYSGHGPETSIGFEMENNSFFRA